MNVVLLTGDSPPHALWTETLEIQRDNARWVADAIAQHIPNVPAYPAFGNHGVYKTTGLILRMQTDQITFPSPGLVLYTLDSAVGH